MRFYLSLIAALLAPFQMGFTMVVVNTMLDNLSESLNFDKNIGGAVASSVFYLGSAIGGLFSTQIEEWTHELSQTAVGLMYLLGSLLCGFSNSTSFCWGGAVNGCIPYMLFFGRVLTGIAAGVGAVISPKYIVEVSSPSTRGLLGVIHEMSMALGSVCGFVIGLPYDFNSFNIGYSWWRIMFLSGIIPAILQALFNCMALIPNQQSSYQDFEQIELVQKEKKELKHESESKSNKGSLQKQVSISTSDIEKGNLLSNNSASKRKDWMLLFDKKYRRCVLLGIFVPIAGQLCGINVLDAYSTNILRDAGFDKAVIGSVLCASTNFIFTSISMIIFEKLNRKTIAYFSFIGMGASLTFIAFSSLGTRETSGQLSVAFVILYIIFFSFGCGTLTLCYAPEVVPPEAEHFVLGAGRSLSDLTALILVMSFPTMLDKAGAIPSFMMLASSCFGTVIFLRLYMVETRNKKLEAIHEELFHENIQAKSAQCSL